MDYLEATHLCLDEGSDSYAALQMCDFDVADPDLAAYFQCWTSLTAADCGDEYLVDGSACEP